MRTLRKSTLRWSSALPRFLWWGFKRASWPERAIVVTGCLLALGLAWPADDSDAALGLHSWPTASVSFDFEGTGWGTLSAANRTAYQGAIEDAADEWDGDTDYAPSIVTTSTNNDIHWGDRPSGWNSSCSAYTSAGQGYAKLCKRFNSYWHITEADMLFNQHRTTWTASIVRGIATHEFGHSGGLNHDQASECQGSWPSRYTMCPSTNDTNAHHWSSLEQHDIDDMNQKY